MISILRLLPFLLALLLAPALAAAAQTRYALVIGNNLGDARDEPLRYAEADARKLHDALRSVGGVAPERMRLLLGEDADAVTSAMARINEEIRVSGDGDGAMLLVYYSGHADATSLHLGTTRLDLNLIERWVRGSPAGIRLLLVDACRSGALTRVKGATAGPPVPTRLQVRQPGQGVVFLTASAAHEDAQESERLRGSFFTHYFVSGLLGAADDNGDGLVALDEAYRHAYSHTLRATSSTWAGTQHPTYRYEFRGQGEIILATLREARADHGTLELPPGRDFLVMRGDEDGPVLVELDAHAPARRISLPAGRYFVRGRGARELVEGNVEVQAGQIDRLDVTRLQATRYARLVRKGGDEGRVVHGVQAAYLLSAPLDGGRLCHGVLAGYTLETRHLTVAPTLGYCRGGFRNDYLTSDAHHIELGARLVHAWDLRGVSLELGAQFGLGWLLQRFETAGRASPRLGPVARLGTTASVLIDLPAGAYLSLALTAGFAAMQRDPGPRAPDRWVALPHAQLAVGLGKRF